VNFISENETIGFDELGKLGHEVHTSGRECGGIIGGNRENSNVTHDNNCGLKVFLCEIKHRIRFFSIYFENMVFFMYFCRN